VGTPLATDIGSYAIIVTACVGPVCTSAPTPIMIDIYPSGEGGVIIAEMSHNTTKKQEISFNITNSVPIAVGDTIVFMFTKNITLSSKCSITGSTLIAISGSAKYICTPNPATNTIRV